MCNAIRVEETASVVKTSSWLNNVWAIECPLLLGMLRSKKGTARSNQVLSLSFYLYRAQRNELERNDYLKIIAACEMDARDEEKDLVRNLIEAIEIPLTDPLKSLLHVTLNG